MFRFLIALTISFFLTGTAYSASPIEQTCKLRAALVSNKSIKPSDVAVELFAWNKNLKPSAVSTALKSMDNLDYDEADVFLMSRIESYYEVHLIAASLPENSPLYFELRYALVGGKFRMNNIEYKDDILKIVPAFNPAGTLKPLDCG